MQAAENFFDFTTIADGVRNLMERRGIPKRRQSKEVSRILNLSFSQAHRKLSGTSPWTLEQLKKITEHFNEPTNTLERPSYRIALSESNGTIHDAMLVIGQRELPCTAWINAPVSSSHHAEFVAIKSAQGWRILETNTVSDHSTPRYQVDKIELQIQQAHLRHIAVIDDDRNSADNLRDYLNESGFHATAFYDQTALETAMHEVEFDGFVVDWLLGTTTAESLIRAIRLSENSTVPIILLTGQLITGKANESDVARAIMEFNVICQEKPTRLSIVAAELSSAIKAL